MTSTTEQKIEVIIAVLTAVGIIATAWSAYQATLWGGIQTFLLRDVAANSNKYLQNTIQQGQRSGMDAIIFVQYINARYDNNTNLSEFYLHRARPELKAAIQAWLKTNPFENPDAPPHPFVMPEYVQEYSLEAAKFAKESEKKMDEAQQANKNSDNYVLMTVLYAAIFFVGGVISKFSSVRLREIVLVVGLIIFSVTTAVLFTMPIAAE